MPGACHWDRQRSPSTSGEGRGSKAVLVTFPLSTSSFFLFSPIPLFLFVIMSVCLFSSQSLTQPWNLVAQAGLENHYRQLRMALNSQQILLPQPLTSSLLQGLIQTDKSQGEHDTPCSWCILGTYFKAAAEPTHLEEQWHLRVIQMNRFPFPGFNLLLLQYPKFGEGKVAGSLFQGGACTSRLSLCWDNIPTRETQRRKGLLRLTVPRGYQPVLEGEGGQQECEVAGHTACTVRKRKELEVGAPFLLFDSVHDLGLVLPKFRGALSPLS